MRAKQLKQGYVYIKNGYSVYYNAGRYFYTALYCNDSAYTLQELKRIVKENHNINL